MGGIFDDTPTPLDELLEANQQVASGAISPEEHTDIIDQIKEKPEEEEEDTLTSEEDDPDAPPSDDDSAPREDDLPKDEIPDIEEESENGATMTTETIRNDHVVRFSSESFDIQVNNNGLLSQTAKGIGHVAVAAYDMGSRLVQYLAPLGIKYTPIIANKILKGVLYLFTRSLSSLYRIIIGVADFKKRFFVNADSLKKKTASLREKLNEVNQKDEGFRDLTTLRYRTETVLKYFSAGGHLDVAKSAQLVKKFLDSTIAPISSAINTEISVLENIINSSGRAFSNELMSQMDVKLFPPAMVGGVVKNYEPRSQFVQGLIYPETLPGELRFMATVPKHQLKGMDEIHEAYQASNMILAASHTFAPMEQGCNYMDYAAVEAMLKEAESILDLCISHKQIYERISQKTKALTFGYRHAYHRLTAAEERVSLQDSVMELVYLKQSFIGRVYVSACIDIHDYALDYVKHLLTFLEKNIGQLK